MPIIKKIIFITFIAIFSNLVNAEEVKKLGKHKDWETFIMKDEKGKICFAQSKPVLQAPKNYSREARLFISFRPGENIANEISITGGFQYNNKNSIMAISGKNKYIFDIVKENFAWIADNKIENKMIKLMQKGSRIMIKAHNQKGSQTTDHYSLLGFTKAYKATKANCS